MLGHTSVCERRGRLVGPPRAELSVPARALEAALVCMVCTPGVAGSQREPILLVPGTTVARTLARHPHVSAEPPLACYVTASCPAALRR